MDRNWPFLIAISLIVPAWAAAADPQMDPPPATSDTPATGNLGQPDADKQAAAYAEEFKVPVQEVQDLRARGMSWADVHNTLTISQKAKVPSAEVTKLRDQGMGWGQIAKKYGLKSSDVTTSQGGEIHDAPADTKKGATTAPAGTKKQQKPVEPSGSMPDSGTSQPAPQSQPQPTPGPQPSGQTPPGTTP